MAKDPENHSIKFKLLLNGTISTAKILGHLLIIPKIKENGTVYVQVMDEMGAKTIIVIQILAFKCPCTHSGKCREKNNIAYPVRPSDYFCQCQDPYTGDQCEMMRLNPCDDIPCYPGLDCFPQNSEEFLCENCPPLFEGDGKQCILKFTQGMK